MKKIILILTVSIALFSCSNESKMKAEIKSYLDKNAKDPKSYEFVDLKITDTIIEGKFAKNKIDSNIDSIKDDEGAIKTNEASLKTSEEDKAKYTDNSFDEIISGAKEDIETSKKAIEQYKNENENLKKHLDSKNILGYLVKHKCRLKNGFGALDLTEYYVEFDKDFKLLKLDKDIDLTVFVIK